MFKIFITILLLSSIILIVRSSRIDATASLTIYVDSKSTNNSLSCGDIDTPCDSILSALNSFYSLNSTYANDTQVVVLLNPGTYSYVNNTGLELFGLDLIIQQTPLRTSSPSTIDMSNSQQPFFTITQPSDNITTATSVSLMGIQVVNGTSNNIDYLVQVQTNTAPVSLFISECTFQSTSISGSGLFIIDSSSPAITTLDMEHSVFDGESSQGDGVLFNLSNLNLTILNVTITNCRSANGFIKATGSNIIINDFFYLSNVNQFDNQIIFINSNVVITQSFFTESNSSNPNAPTRSSLIYSSNSTIKVNGTLFANQMQLFQLQDGTTANLVNNVFTQNNIPQDPMIYQNSSSLTMTNSLINFNTVPQLVASSNSPLLNFSKNTIQGIVFPSTQVKDHNIITLLNVNNALVQYNTFILANVITNVVECLGGSAISMSGNNLGKSKYLVTCQADTCDFKGSDKVSCKANSGSSDSTDTQPLTKGQIIGIALGTTAAFAAGAVIIVVLYKRYKRHNHYNSIE